MKTIIRVPLPDEYAYIELESQDEMTPEDTMMAYHEYRKAAWGGEGIGIKELAKAVYSYATTGQIEGGADLQGRYSKNESLLISELTKLIRAKKN